MEKEERIEEIKKELNHLDNILKGVNPNSDAYDFEYYQRNLLRDELEKLEKK